MKRMIALLTASLMASATFTMPALSQGHGDGASSAAESAPGQMKGEDESARDHAPGQLKGEDESATQYAPGQIKQADTEEEEVDLNATASTGEPTFGTLISSIRRGNADLSDLEHDATINVVPIDDLVKGNNLSALENALSVNDDQIDQLRGELADLDLNELSDEDAGTAVAVRVEADGSLTVFTD
jgi:hypothetical protein